MFSLAKLVLALAASASAASAVVIRSTNDVFSPPITSPQAGDTWVIGSQHIVTWDTSNIPHQNQGQTGLIVLGHIDDDNDSEHLDFYHPLASGFHITDGAANVTIPSVPSRSDYILVLFGDSGNTSPKFTIQ